jgi:hypothetical protein
MKKTSILSLAKIQENKNPFFNPPYLFIPELKIFES